jgi:hypothetical protein
MEMVWCPQRIVLIYEQTASTYIKAFEELLDLYEQIGEQLPLASQYGRLMSGSSDLLVVLGSLYKDIFEFHLRAYKYFQQKRE